MQIGQLNRTCTRSLKKARLEAEESSSDDEVDLTTTKLETIFHNRTKLKYCETQSKRKVFALEIRSEYCYFYLLLYIKLVTATGTNLEATRFDARTHAAHITEAFSLHGVSGYD